MMLIQTAWLEAARFLGRGISTDNLHQGYKSISEIGHGGNFLTDDLTLNLLRSEEFFENSLLDYSGGYEDAPSLLESAHEKVEDLIRSFKSPVPDRIQADLREYFEKIYKKQPIRS
jgi:trimethylamine:corrinoid methyltransferase-like protein